MTEKSLHNRSRWISLSIFIICLIFINYLLFFVDISNPNAALNILIEAQKTQKIIFLATLAFLAAYIFVTTQFIHFKRKYSIKNKGVEKSRHTIIRLILKVFTVLIIGSIGFFWYKEKLLVILTKPLIDSGHELLFMSLPEAFFAYLHVSFLFGLIFSSPIILFFVCEYVAKGLKGSEKTYVIILSALQLLTVMCSVFYLSPEFLKLGLQYSTVTTIPSVRGFLAVSSTFNLFIALFIWLPGTTYFFLKYKINDMLKARILNLIVAILIGAIITPPDLITFSMVVFPMLALFEIGAISAVFSNRKEWEWIIGKNIH